MSDNPRAIGADISRAITTDSATIKSADMGLSQAARAALDRHPAAVYLAGLSETGRRSQRRALDLAAEILGAPDCFALDWAKLRYAHVQALRTRLVERGYRPATINKTLVAVRQTLRQAWLLGLMNAQDYQLAREVKAVTGESTLAGRALTADEIGKLAAACKSDPGPRGVRDLALLSCLYPGGLRRQEVVNLDLSDCTADYERGRLVIRLLVHGKRRKDRIVYLSNGAAQAIRAWLDLRGNDPGPLFWHVSKAERLVNRRLTTQAVYFALCERGKQAGLRHFSPHDLRRSVASDLIDAGTDIVTVAAHLGHEAITTTQKYDRRPEEARKKAISRLKLPW